MISARTVYRRAYWLRNDAKYWREIARLRTLVYLGGGGMGDALLCSAVVRELDRRARGSVSAMLPYPELFDHSSSIRSVHAPDHDLVLGLQRWGRSVYHPEYAIPQAQPPIVPRRSDHIIAQMCRSAEITGEIELRPDLDLRPEERSFGTQYRDAVLVQSSTLNAANVIPAKEWPSGKMAAVVDAIRGRYRVVQVGHPGDPLLPGVEDLRGKLALRELAAVMANARFFIGLVGFLMHLARAVGTRCVIVYGGREHPLQSGYPANENVCGDVPCAPCGIDGPCSIGHGCMNQIEPTDVFDAINRLEARREAELETDRIVI